MKTATVLLSAALSGCSVVGLEPIVVAAAGAGTQSAISHTLSGSTYRTFTASLGEVENATLDAFERMGISLQSIERAPARNTIIRGLALRRRIEIELEPISAKTTRMEVTAKNGGFTYDGATATEIVLQAEKSLDPDAGTSSAGTGRRRRGD